MTDTNTIKQLRRKAGHRQAWDLAVSEVRKHAPFSTDLWLDHCVGRYGDDREGAAAFLLWDVVRRPWNLSTDFAPRLTGDKDACLAYLDSEHHPYPDSGPAKDLLLASFAVAEMAFSLVHEPARKERFTTCLKEAVDSYARYWRHGRPAQGTGCHVAEPLWPQSAAPDPSTQQEQWREWAKASLDRSLAACEVPPEDVPSQVALAMVRDGVYWLLGWETVSPEKKTRVLFVGETRDVEETREFGVAGTLAARRWEPDPERMTRPVFYPDPRHLGLTTLESTFREGMDRAARHAFQRFPEKAAACCWRLQFAPASDIRVNDSGWTEEHRLRPPYVKGASGSAAAACALRAVLADLPLDPSVCVTAELENEVTGGLKNVTGKVAKVREAAADAAVSTVLVVESSDLLDREGRLAGIRTQVVGTIDQAMDWISGRLGEVMDFLVRLESLALQGHLLFAPPGMAPEEWVDFCLPPRVIREREWQDFRRGRRGETREGSDPLSGHGYCLPTELLVREDERETHRAKPPSPVLLVDVLQTRPGLFLLRGEPGEGKTVALWWSLAQQCRRLREDLAAENLRIDRPEFRVPLGIALQLLPNPGQMRREVEAFRASLEPEARASLQGVSELDCWGCRCTLAIAYPGRQGPGMLLRWLGEKLRRGEVRLYLDSLDELISLDLRSDEAVGAPTRRDWLGQQLSAFLQGQPSGTRPTALLTARWMAELQGFPGREELRLVCLGPGEVRQYVDRYFRHAPDRGRALNERLRLTPGPGHLARLPLLLATLCEIHDQGEDPLPETRTGVLRLALRQILRRGDKQHRGQQTKRKVRDELKEQFLRQVAYHGYYRENLPIDPTRHGEALERILQDVRGRYPQYRLPETLDGLLVELAQDGILVPHADAYRFVLRSFHEYCLAGWIARECSAIERREREAFITMIRSRWRDWPGKGEQVTAEEENIKPLNQPGWWHVWPLVAGQMDEDGRADWFLDALWREHEEKEDVGQSRLMLAARAAVEVSGPSQFRGRIVEAVRGIVQRILQTGKDSDGGPS